MERQELFFTDMGQCFAPAQALSTLGDKKHWRLVEYTASEFSGTMIVALDGALPEDVSFSPKLTGWYKVCLGIYGTPGSELFVRFSDEVYFENITGDVWDGWKEIVVTHWRTADMTGKSIVLSAQKGACGQQTYLACIRFIPLTEAEVEEYRTVCAAQETKRLYATVDMHGLLCCTNIDSISDWLSVTAALRDSDVEFVAFEDTRHFTLGSCPIPPDDFAFVSAGHKHAEIQSAKYDRDEILKMVCSQAREFGVKPCISMRLGAWGFGFPLDNGYFTCPFYQEHPEFRCVERDGTPISKLSYAYPEVRQYVIRQLVHAAGAGCHAVSLIAHRAPCFVLYEKPVADRFFELYGEYPYTYPLDEPRLQKLHCDIMTEFVQELRNALDDAYGKGKIRIHLRGYFTLYHTKMLGFDCEELARRGLLEAVVSYPARTYETFDESVWEDGEKTRINVERFSESSRHFTSTIHRDEELDFIEPFVDYRGVSIGPKTQQERVQEWMDFEKRTGVKVYFDIFPREMLLGEYRRRAAELYDAGAQRLGLWDTPARAQNRARWNALRCFGHKDELQKMLYFERDTHYYKVMTLGGWTIGRYDAFWGG